MRMFFIWNLPFWWCFSRLNEDFFYFCGVNLSTLVNFILPYKYDANLLNKVSSFSTSHEVISMFHLCRVDITPTSGDSYLMTHIWWYPTFSRCPTSGDPRRSEQLAIYSYLLIISTISDHIATSSYHFSNNIWKSTLKFNPTFKSIFSYKSLFINYVCSPNFYT